MQEDLHDDLFAPKPRDAIKHAQNAPRAPSGPNTGDIYHNTTDDKFYVFDGKEWREITIADYKISLFKMTNSPHFNPAQYGILRRDGVILKFVVDE